MTDSAGRLLAVLVVFACGVLTGLPARAQSVTLRGQVLTEDGKAEPLAIVRVTGTPSAAANAQQPALPMVHVIRADQAGRYTFELLPGNYEVDALSASGELGAQAHSGLLRVESPIERNLIIRPSTGWAANRALIFTLAGLAGYLLILLVFRYYNIIAPTRALLLAQIESVKTRLDMEVEQSQGATALVDELDQVAQRFQAVAWGAALFWSRGEELAAWSRIHEVERQLATLLAPPPRVLERVQTAESELRDIGKDEASQLADRMREALRTHAALVADPTADPQQIEGSIARLKHQLAEGLAIVYGERDTKFSALMEWQNKSMWLTNVALMLVAALAFAFDHEWLFLVGAAGGLMSRLARALFREDVPSDYGASWTTLFLSPLLGAIAAWFGILLIVTLVQLGVLGTVLAAITWPPQVTPMTLTFAFLLGFSERFFTTLLGAVEGHVDKQVKTPKPAAAPTAGTLGAGAGAEPGAGAGAGVGAAGGAGAAAGAGGPGAGAELAVRLLDIVAGERAAVIGDAQGPIHQRLVAVAGASHVFTVDLAQIQSVAPLDGVVLERVPDPAALEAAAVAIHQALAENGRVVVMGSTPAGLYEADAMTQRGNREAGPALVHDVMTGPGRLLAQEPPERLESGDRVRWIAAFVKSPAAAGL